MPARWRLALRLGRWGYWVSNQQKPHAASGIVQEAQKRREQFGRMLLEAEVECDRDGSFSVAEMLAETDALIACHRQ